MPDETKGRLLEFIMRAGGTELQQPTPNAGGPLYALYSLHREPAVLVSYPLFELMVLSLYSSDSLADNNRAFAQELARLSGIEIVTKT